MRINKVIVTNKTALRSKYGALDKVEAALDYMVDRNKQRGLHTKLIDVSNKTQMKSVKGSKVTKPSSARQNKKAIDKIYKHYTPDYILILGAPDVIPHQELINPLYSGSGDVDEFVDSDLPYACEQGYSQQIGTFTGPTRVVGRLPDEVGATKTTALRRIIRVAANYRSRPRKQYESHLAVSARCWQKSTDQSIRNIFGGATNARTNPKAGPTWTKKEFGRLSHFFNLHGSPASYFYWGQNTLGGPVNTVGHDARKLSKKISEGTVVAAECCYGAELYDPAVRNGQAGICNIYLNEKAYAFFGSSTIAYGPAEGNGQADLITQYFFKHILEGASSGRASLQARQVYLANNSPLDPYDMKTLAQFNLMGDPSVHPVIRSDLSIGNLLNNKSVLSNFSGTLGKTFTLGLGTSSLASPVESESLSLTALPGIADKVLNHVAGISVRRGDLMRNGLNLAETVLLATIEDAHKPSNKIRNIIKEIADQNKIELSTLNTFAIDSHSAVPIPRMKSAFAQTAKTAFFHIGTGTIREDVLEDADAGGKLRQLYAIVMQEEEGRITSVKKLYSK